MLAGLPVALGKNGLLTSLKCVLVSMDESALESVDESALEGVDESALDDVDESDPEVKE